VTLNPEQQRRTVLASGFSNPLNLACNVEDETHVSVYGDDELLSLGADYTVDGAGDFGDLDEIDGVNIILEADVLLEGYESYTVVHLPPQDQATSLASGGTLGRIYEAALDAIMRRVQSLSSQLSRRLRLPVDSDADPLLPHPEPRRALVWNDTGTALINTESDPDTEPLTSAAAILAEVEAVAEEVDQDREDAEAAAAAALADRILAQEAAAEAGDLSALLQYLVPVGTSIMHNATAAPDNYLKENGAAVSRATYAALFAVIGTTFGAGDGSTTFNLPESRGEFFRGLDDGRGVDSGRTIGSAQSEMIGPHAHTASTDSGGGHTHDVSINLTTRYGANSGGAQQAWAGGDSINGNATVVRTTTTGGSHSHTVTVNNNSGTENRPRNKAKLMCIKY
jgi:microcystin-dependent protein